MKIINLSLPHPILGIKDDIVGNFTIDPIVELYVDRIDISLNNKVSNITLEKMLNNKTCAYCIEVSCQNTLYRKSFVFFENNSQITIASHDFFGKVDVQVFIVATCAIENYSPDGTNSDYYGYKFKLVKGDVMGFGGVFSFIAEKNWRNLKKLTSFIVIEKNEIIENGPVEYDLSGDRIVIKVSKEDYTKSKNLQGYPHIPEIFHSAIIYPALLHAVTAMFFDQESYEGNKWCDYIGQIIESDEELKSINRNDPDSAVIATQSILKNPLSRTLRAVEQMEDEASEDPEDLGD